MSLVDWLEALDVAAFKFINITLYNREAAALLKFFANDVTVVVALAAGIYLIARNYRPLDRLNLGFGLWSVIATNILCTFILKPLFRRPRPVVSVPGMHQLAWVSKSSFSFPSTHSAMAAAISVVLWGDYPAARPWITAFNLALWFFCVYTGGHYPADVMAGVFVGLGAGSLFLLGKVKIQKLKVKSEAWDKK